MQELVKPFDVPIILIAFNRLDLVKRQLEILKDIQAQELLVVCDAPREGNRSDVDAVKSVHALFDSISWNCTVLKNYAEKNMGCDKRIVSGLNWAFNQVDKAIVLEDDCIPNLDFFGFARELLLRYQDDTNVFYISGTNMIKKYRIEDSYSFVYRASTWGWATWRRAWETFDFDDFVAHWDEEKKKKIKWPYLLPGDRHHWIKEIELNRARGAIPWDYCWVWHVMKKGKFSIVPQKNLIENDGFRTDATHTTVRPECYDGTLEDLDFPLQHPTNMKLDKRFYFENWKYEKPKYIKKIVDIDFYRRQLKKLHCKLKKE